MGDKRYLFSVIVPIYNVEDYLEEALESILRQTIGFKENIQLILVNDGSPDNSGAICEKYQSRYPDNVLYIEKPNGGVSSARNEGIKHIKGDYTIFVDGDDTWKEDALEIIAGFLKEHTDEINVCSCRMLYSGDFSQRTHPLDYKYEEGMRVVNLKEEPDIISSTIGNVVVRSDAIGEHRFNENISAGEDSSFVNGLLLDKCSLGIIPEAIFYYRRNVLAGSGSSSAPNRKSWYKEVPEGYYLGLINRSLKKYNEVPKFIQYVILYDIRWRHYNPHMMQILSEEEKAEYIRIMSEVMSYIDNRVLRKAKGLPQAKKLYLLNLKYGEQVIDKVKIVRKHKAVYNESVVLNFQGKRMLEVKVLDLKDNTLRLEGVTQASIVKDDYSLKIKDNQDNVYSPELIAYSKEDFYGFIGEPVVKGERFFIDIPINSGDKLTFVLIWRGIQIPLKPSYEPYIGLSRNHQHSYCVKEGYIVKIINNRLCFYRDTNRTRMASEARYAREMIKEEGMSWLVERRRHLKIQKAIDQKKLVDRVAFISVRADNKLLGNMEKVYDALELPKVKLSKLKMHTFPDYEKRAAILAYTSKVVVTDDYLYLFRNQHKKKGQSFIQLWHATGAGKYFGLDALSLFPGCDSLYHRDYDVVTVSSEGIRNVYASAFGIPVERVEALGVARTDDLFDEAHINAVKERVYDSYPELIGKKVILYTPTFRDVPGPRNIFRPELDFHRLSEELADNQVFVLCPHPVMTEQIVDGAYSNVLEIRDIPTNDMMFVSDSLISDYSSTMFEYSLLRKPMAFFCYDYDSYDREFYIDFENELPGPILRTQEELFDYLKNDMYDIMEQNDEFYHKFMGACDGHSTERIVKRIEDLYYGRI